jgi:FHA domain-containing protein
VGIRLRVTDETGQGRMVQLENDAAVIGRDLTCDLVLDSIFVSRFHARLCHAGGSYEITDLDSRNGIELGGKLIDHQSALNAGDSFIIGPFQLELVDRHPIDQPTQDFRALRRSEQPLIVDPATHEVLIGGVPVRPPLSRLEFRLLQLLYEAGGTVCERDELGNSVWGADQWDLNMLHRLVHRLKEKIEPAPDRPRYIVTVAGVGYRLQTK